jgi:acyl-CoA reductase-like NAD-dependent aldehyde dehydrogenase
MSILNPSSLYAFGWKYRNGYWKLSPIDGTCQGEYACSTRDEVAEHIQIARTIQADWANVPLWTRGKILETWADLILAEAQESEFPKDNHLLPLDCLPALITKEVGKPLAQSLDGDMLPAVSWLKYVAKHGTSWLQPKPLPWDKSILMGRTHTMLRQPKGVVGVITPWNYPVAIPVSGIASALMSGNTVVWKPSELVPLVSNHLYRLLKTSIQSVLGVETPLVNIVQMAYGDAETGEAVAHGRIDHLIFTGSSRAGKRIQVGCASRGVPYTMELGGQDAMIILRESDPDITTSYALWGRLVNAGQACAAVKKVYVPKNELQDWIQRLKSKFEAVKVGNPFEASSHMGPLISFDQRDLVHQQVQDAIEKGAICHTGGHPVFDDAKQGAYYTPTLLSNVPELARAYEEEIFGPVLCVYGYDDPRDLPDLLNQSSFGLSASIFGELPMAEALAEKLQVGMLSINDLPTIGFAMPQVPWTGRKASGSGISHSEEGVLSLTHPQVITRNWMRFIPGLEKPFWHLGPEPNLDLPREMLQSFHDASLLHKMKPSFLSTFWRHRGPSRW